MALQLVLPGFPGAPTVVPDAAPADAPPAATEPPPIPIAPGQLGLLSGPHVAATRFAHALAHLTLDAALADAPRAVKPLLARIATAAAVVEPAERAAALGALWPSVDPTLATPLARLLGRTLASQSPPGAWAGEPAGAWLLRGGERESARDALRAELAADRRSVRAWAVLAQLEPWPALARLAWHGGRVLPAMADVLELIQEDALYPAVPWVPIYAFLTGELALEDLRSLALDEGLSSPPADFSPGDARAFATWLLVALEGGIPPRAALKRLSPAAFKRVLPLLAGELGR